MKMIKKLIFVLMGMMLMVCVAGCAKEEEAKEVVGGYEEVTDGTITEERREIFEKAMEGFAGVDYTPIELLATQVVAGTNYRFLCEATGVYPGAETTKKIVTVYVDLDGNAEILEIEDVEEENAQIANPFVEYGSLEEMNANAEVKFEVLPLEIGAYKADSFIYAAEMKLAEVIYHDGENEIVIRKAPYTVDEENHEVGDISGDHNTYEVNAVADGIDFACSLAGNNGLINKAVWEDGEYAYAIIINAGTDNGMEQSEVIELVRTVR